MNAAQLMERTRNLAGALRRRGEVERRERWPRDRLLPFQHQRLVDVVTYASRHSPFYRQRFGGVLDAKDVRLDQLPVTTKPDLMEHFDQVVTDPRLRRADLETHLEHVRDDDLHLGEYRVMASGGSSGIRGVYVYSRADWKDVLDGVFRFTRLAGIKPTIPRTRIASVSSPDAKHMSFRGSVSMDVGLFDQLRMGANEPLPTIVEALNAHQPHFIFTYSSMGALLAKEQLAGRLQLQLRAICTTGEVAAPGDRELLRQAFGSTPFNFYGMTETGNVGIECALHNGLHAFEDHALIEAVDENNRPVPPGTPSAHILVTNLYNRTQPIIRMEVSDMLTLDPSACACGLTFQRIAALEGRADDLLDLPTHNGPRTIHPILLRSPLSNLRDLAEYQIVQEPHALRVRLVPTPGARAEALAGEVKRRLEAVLHKEHVVGVDIAPELTMALPRDGGAGKLKVVRALPRV